MNTVPFPTRKGWTEATLDRLGIERDEDGRYVFPTANGPERYADDGRTPKLIAPAGVRRELWPDPADVAGDVLLVGEGRPDVLSAAELGFAAVSVPSARRLRDDEALRIAEGWHRVYVIGDCDAPAKPGRRMARQWAEMLANYCSTFLVELDAGRTDGFDVGDVLTEGGPDYGRAFLQSRLDEAEHVFAPDPLDDAPASGAALALLVDMTAVSDEPPEYVIWPLAAKGALTLLVGKRSSYKTFVALLAAARCHAGGGKLAGLRCAPARALYVDAENGPRLMRRRFTACGIAPDGLLMADGTLIRLPRRLKLLRELVRATGADLVILDALRRLTPSLDEDSSRDMAPVIADLANLARELNVAVLLLHHQSSKPGAPPSRGSSAIEDQADVVMRLTRHGGRRLKLWVGEGGKFRIDEEPEPLWLSMSTAGGLLTIGATEPAAEDDDDEAEPSAEDRLVDRIEGLAGQVRADLNGGGWAPSRLAAAVGTTPDNGTFKRALGQLLDGGAWTGEGKGKARRVRPAESGQPGRPIRDGLIGPVHDDPQMAVNDDPEGGTG